MTSGVLLRVYGRIHVTLIGLDASGYRVNGGVGFAIDNPYADVTAYPSRSFRLRDRRRLGMNESEVARVRDVIESEMTRNQFDVSIEVDISGHLDAHVGFGSSTALRLACLEALYLLNGHKWERAELVRASGRGGTSGIGINTYFDGGMVMDVGRSGRESGLLPSSASETRLELPLVLLRSRMPNWALGVCVPVQLEPLTEAEESTFFERTLPIPSQEVYRALYHSVYGIAASVCSADLSSFKRSIVAIQSCAWKTAERQIYGEHLERIESLLYQSGATAVGMSSLGPALYFVGNDLSSVSEQICSANPDLLVFTCQAQNQGRQLQYV